MEPQDKDTVALDLGDPYIGGESTDEGVPNQGFQNDGNEVNQHSNQTTDTDTNQVTDTGSNPTIDSQPDIADGDFTTFLDEIAGDVEVPEEVEDKPILFSLGGSHHTNLDDIVEEDSSEDERTKKKQVTTQNPANITIHMSDSEEEDDHIHTDKRVQFHLEYPPKKQHQPGKSQTSLNKDQSASSFSGSHFKIGQRRSSMTPLGTSSFGQNRKLSVQLIRENSKSQFDHTPHELYIELDELRMKEGGEFEWKQKARWIKFEQNVEEGSNKWGKAHVSSLAFHSLLDLRKCIEQGVVLLDLQADTMEAIASQITEQLNNMELLKYEHTVPVQKLLLNKHKHIHSWSFINRSASSHIFSALSGARRASSVKLENTSESRRRSLFAGFKSSESKSSNDSGQHGQNGTQNNNLPGSNGSALDKNTMTKVVSDSKMSDISSNDNQETRIPHSPTVADPAIMKCLAQGSETASVLVGEVEYLDKPMAAFVRLAHGCDIDNLTDVPLPLRFVFVLLGPPNTHIDYYEIGRSISTLMSNTSFHEVAYLALSRTDILKALNGFLDESVVLPPGDIAKDVLLPIIAMARQKEKEKKRKQMEEEEEPTQEIAPPEDPLKRTGRPFGGMIRDVKKRYPYYWSDIKDAFNLQCLATFFFVYFACLSPAITFGGLLSAKTETYLGVTEMLVGTFACGTVFALMSGQPLLVLGGTGPVLVFEEGLFQFCQTVGLDFLSMRFWVGIWVSLIVIIVIALEGVFLVRYFTRFTEEIFASLISLIFIIEVFIKISNQFQSHPLQEYYIPIPQCVEKEDLGMLSNMVQTTLSYFTTAGYAETTTASMLLGNHSLVDNNATTPAFDYSVCDKNKPNTALLSMILTFSTFFIAYFLKQFRNSHFLGRTARRALGDFGIPIAITTLLVVDILIDDTYTEKLIVPNGMVPTNSSKRGWFVNPLGHSKTLPVWCMFAAAIPALLLFILLFMESLITSVIVNKPERNLKKGTGYHLDMMLVGLFATFGGIVGTPFLTVATVRSVTHVSSLSVYSNTNAPGEKAKLVEVKEQRLTAFFVHILIGLSTLLGPVLRHIPLAVLFGVFLYMGVASMSGIQLFDRVQLFFMPTKHHPDVGYVKKVRLWKMHLFTIIQLICLGILWVVKSTAAALAFPFVLILMVPFRLHILKFIFNKQELHELDEDGETAEDREEESDDEPDFYKQAHMPF